MLDHVFKHNTGYTGACIDRVPIKFSRSRCKCDGEQTVLQINAKSEHAQKFLPVLSSTLTSNTSSGTYHDAYRSMLVSKKCLLKFILILSSLRTKERTQRSIRSIICTKRSENGLFSVSTTLCRHVAVRICDTLTIMNLANKVY